MDDPSTRSEAIELFFIHKNMDKDFEIKLSRFSAAITKTNNPVLVDFWNEIIDIIIDRPIEVDILEGKLFEEIDRVAKLQTYIRMRNRLLSTGKSNFASKYDIHSIFDETPQYWDYMQKALNYEFKDSKPRPLKKSGDPSSIRRRLGFRSIVEIMEEGK